MFLIGTPIHSNRDGVMTYGGRLNVSMINWHVRERERHDHGAGRHRSLGIPYDLRLLYARPFLLLHDQELEREGGRQL